MGKGDRNEEVLLLAASSSISFFFENLPRLPLSAGDTYCSSVYFFFKLSV